MISFELFILQVKSHTNVTNVDVSLSLVVYWKLIWRRTRDWRNISVKYAKPHLQRMVHWPDTWRFIQVSGLLSVHIVMRRLEQHFTARNTWDCIDSRVILLNYILFSRTVRSERLIFSVWCVLVCLLACLLVDSCFNYWHQVAHQVLIPNINTRWLTRFWFQILTLDGSIGSNIFLNIKCKKFKILHTMT